MLKYCKYLVLAIFVLFGIVSTTFAVEPFYADVPWGAAPEEVKARYTDVKLNQVLVKNDLVLFRAMAQSGGTGDQHFYFARRAGFSDL